ncbi:MAG: PqqD family protein [Acidobacteriota bacterium]|nr:MAG: PqqD family protein [Acidobacteriota bacterium]
MQGGNYRIVTKERTSFTELLDNREGIILDLENLHYFTLNGSGVLIWKLLRSGACGTADELAARLRVAYGLDPERADADLVPFLEELKAQGLISPAESVTTGVVGGDSIDDRSLPAYESPVLKVSESLSNVTLSGSSTVATAAIATGGNG